MFFVLVQPPMVRRVVSSVPSLGLPYIAAILKQKNVQVSCLCADVEGLNSEDVVNKIITLKPDVVGFSIATPAAKSAYTIAKAVREKLKNTVLIAGGPHMTILPEEALNNGFDYVVVGEGEYAISDFVDFLKNRKNLEEVRNLVYFDKDRILKFNIKAPPIEDLDELPLPDWSLFPVEKYNSEFKKGKLSLPIMTSRGCPGQCIFCYKGLFGNRFRMRSPQSVLKEIKYLKDELKVESFDILDDYFTAVPNRVLKICELLTKEKINLPWGLPSGIRADTVSEELLLCLWKAGCYRVGFGAESGNNTVLKKIKKFTTREQTKKAVKISKDIGFETSCFFMIGNLYETEQTINDTIEFAKELEPDIAQFTMATPYPGSEMFNILKEQNRILSFDWNDYDYFCSRNQVFSHENIEYSLLRKKINEAYRSFYFRPKYVIKILKRSLSLRGIYNLARSFFRLINVLNQ